MSERCAGVAADAKVTTGRRRRDVRRGCVCEVCEPRHLLSTYYVSSITGADSSGHGSSAGSPFKTIQYAADRTNPGDTVLVMDGTYSNAYAGGDVVDVSRSGTAAGWITYKAYPGAHPKLQFNGWNGFRVAASYIEINGFEVQGNNANITLTYAMQQQSVDDPLCNGNGIMVDGRQLASAPNHIRILNSSVHDCGGGGISTAFADYVTIQNNTVYNNSLYSHYDTSGISIWESWNSDADTGTHMFIIANRIYGNQNLVPYPGTSSVTDGNGIIIDTNNYTATGHPAYSARTLVYNNIVFNNGGRGLEAFLSNHVDFFNNSCYGNAFTSSAMVADTFINQESDVRVCNNIIYARSDRATTATYGVSNVTFDYNIYYGGNAVAVMGAHDRQVNPKYVNPTLDPTTANFHLQATSPAIDTASATYAPTTDFDGNPRPMGSGYDIGAYEFWPPPTVTGFVVDDGAAQRSMLTKLTVTFSEAVTLGSGTMIVLKLRGAALSGLTVTATNPGGDQKTWVLTFSGSPITGGSLPDGVYRLQIPAAGITDGGGNHLAGDYNSTRFFRLFGDMNGDRQVDRTDLASFRSCLGLSASSALWFDYDGSGVIDAADYAQLRKRLLLNRA